MASSRHRLGWRRRLWRILTRGVCAALLIDVAVLTLLVAGGGRPQANLHPWARSGGGAWAEMETR